MSQNMSSGQASANAAIRQKIIACEVVKEEKRKEQPLSR